MDKIIEKVPFLGSQRFWQLVIVVTLFVMNKYGVFDTNEVLKAVSEILQIVGAGSVTIRTLDKVNEGSNVNVENIEDVTVGVKKTSKKSLHTKTK